MILSVFFLSNIPINGDILIFINFFLFNPFVFPVVKLRNYKATTI